MFLKKPEVKTDAERESFLVDRGCLRGCSGGIHLVTEQSESYAEMDETADGANE
jgi:hypothetical protein